MKRLSIALTALAVTSAILPGAALAQVPEGEITDLPVLSRETPRGSGRAVDSSGTVAVPKVADGDISDWTGTPTRFGGTAVLSAGELVYQDHLFDAHGPDDGRDASRLAKTDPIEEAAPETYRLDALAQADATGQLGVPAPEQYSYGESYGDATSHQDARDLEEVRVATGGGDLSILARTTTMTARTDTALLVLADTMPGSTLRPVPFGSGLQTSTGDVALFVADGTVLAADLATGVVSPVAGAQAVASPEGWTNALEAQLPLGALGSIGDLSLAIAAGKPSESTDGFAHLALETSDEVAHANVANVAFRFDEPVRTWFEKNQAMSLQARSIDPFFIELDTASMEAGVSQAFEPSPGYHDRIFVSDPSTGVPQEKGRDGIFQHYGVYLPESYAGDPVPLQWWLHWRGGSAHTGGAVVPKVFKQFGEDRDTIVVSPSGRGTSTWYNGRGHVDIRQVWADVFDTFAVDRGRVYVTGHSMGGWGSYLLTLLYPDRFAAAAPVAGPVTQGAWTGADFPGCDSMKFDEYSPCYIEANESRPRDQHTRKLLENARHVPYAILHGTSDELVPYSGVFRQAERLVQLGYRHRLYTYPGYEHYTHPVMDQWAEAASYLHSFSRPENPARVTYKRDMPFEVATEEVQSGGAKLNFDFDTAYWMSELTADDAARGVASFDGRSLAIADQPHVAAPDTAAPTAPGQTGPYVVTGIQWLTDPTATIPRPTNAFDVDLSGASAVRLDLERMSIDTASPIAGAVSAADPVALRLDGNWAVAPEVTLDGQSAPVSFSDGIATVTIPQGSHNLLITPGSAPPDMTASQITFTEGSADSGQYSDEATLEASLTDAAGNALAGETVSFSLGSSAASAVTDGRGIASATLRIVDAPGEQDAVASFAGRAGEITPSIVSSSFRVEKEDSSTALTVAGRGSKRSLAAELTDADSAAAISGASITFTANGKEIGTSTTDGSGIARLEVPPAHRGNGVVFTATYPGGTFFLGSSDSTTA